MDVDVGCRFCGEVHAPVPVYGGGLDPAEPLTPGRQVATVHYTCELGWLYSLPGERGARTFSQPVDTFEQAVMLARQVAGAHAARVEGALARGPDR